MPTETSVPASASSGDQNPNNNVVPLLMNNFRQRTRAREKMQDKKPEPPVERKAYTRMPLGLR